MEENNNIQLPFGKINYILMGVGIIILALGYILLAGGGSDDPNVFNPAMFDAQRLVEIIAIMYKSKK